MAEPEHIMESSCGLACVIQQLQDEIRKLETENKELRGQLSLPLTDTSPTNSERRDGTPENHTNLRRNVSAPALEGQYKGKTMQSYRVLKGDFFYLYGQVIILYAQYAYL